MLSIRRRRNSLPKLNNGPTTGNRNANGGGVTSTIAILALLIACGGLGATLLSSQARVKDLAHHQETLLDELTWYKTHLHHIEAQHAHKEHDMQHMQAKLDHYRQQDTGTQLELVKQQKRAIEQSLTGANNKITKLQEGFDAANTLIEAYKQHLSDEIASHHTREDNWLRIQQEWEQLDREMQAEINLLRQELQKAKMPLPAGGHEHHHIPEHIGPDQPVVEQDVLYQNLPPPQVHQQQAGQHQLGQQQAGTAGQQHALQQQAAQHHHGGWQHVEDSYHFQQGQGTQAGDWDIHHIEPESPYWHAPPHDRYHQYQQRQQQQQQYEQLQIGHTVNELSMELGVGSGHNG